MQLQMDVVNCEDFLEELGVLGRKAESIWAILTKVSTLGGFLDSDLCPLLYYLKQLASPR